MQADDFFSLTRGRRGHFLYESGYHSDVWLDLEDLCRRPQLLRPYLRELSGKVSEWSPQLICGALVEGAFLALMTAQELNCEFAYALRVAESHTAGLFPVKYQVPEILRHSVADRRVVIVNDVISAGSAVRGTLESLQAAGARVLGVASLVALGRTFHEFAVAQNLPFETLVELPISNLWEPADCPLCAAQIALEKPGNA